MSNFTKTIFQKISNSISNLFPQTSNDNQNDNQNDNRRIISSGTRRLASEAFDDSRNAYNCKRAKLNHDPMNLPNSRILNRPFTNQCRITNNTIHNDNFSDVSDHSNVSISTSGVSSLNPRPKAAEFISNLFVTPLTLQNKNVIKCQRLDKDTMSNHAKRILNRLDKLSTPITGTDKVKGLEKVFGQLNNTHNSLPYSKETITKRKRSAVNDAVTISNSSRYAVDNPKNMKRMKKIGYFDEDVDLDYEKNELQLTDKIPTISQQIKLDMSHIPLMKTTGTNTEKISVHTAVKPKDLLSFSFRCAKSLYDEIIIEENPEELDESSDEESEQEENYGLDNSGGSKTSNEHFKPVAKWRCETCFSENEIISQVCIQCSNVTVQKDVINRFNKMLEAKKSENISNIVKNNLFSGINEIDSKDKSENVATSINSKSSIFSAVKPVTFPAFNLNSVNTNITSCPIDSTFVVTSSNDKKAVQSINTKEQNNFVFNSNSIQQNVSSNDSTPAKLFSFGASTESKPIKSINKITSESESITTNLSQSNASFSFAAAKSESKNDSMGSESNKTFTFGGVSTSNSELSKPLSLNSSTSASKPLSFDSAISKSTSNTAMSNSSSTDKPFEITATSLNNSDVLKPFSFVSSVNSTSDSSKSNAFGFGSTSSTESAKPFTFLKDNSNDTLKSVMTNSFPFASTSNSTNVFNPTSQVPETSNGFAFAGNSNTSLTSSTQPFIFNSLAPSGLSSTTETSFSFKPQVNSNQFMFNSAPTTMPNVINPPSNLGSAGFSFNAASSSTNLPALLNGTSNAQPASFGFSATGSTDRVVRKPRRRRN